MYCVPSPHFCQPHPHIQINKDLELLPGANTQTSVIGWKVGLEQVPRASSAGMVGPAAREGILKEADLGQALKPGDSSVLFSLQETFSRALPAGCRASKGPSSRNMAEKPRNGTEGWIQKGLGQEGVVRASGYSELHQSPGPRSGRDPTKPLGMEVAVGSRQLNQEWGGHRGQRSWG